MPDAILDNESFEAAILRRFATDPSPVSTDELKYQLSNGTFGQSRIAAGLIEQLSLIVKELNDRPDPDLAAQALRLLEQLHQYCQIIPLDLPHVFVSDS